jgi:hypothetical protein
VIALDTNVLRNLRPQDEGNPRRQAALIGAAGAALCKRIRTIMTENGPEPLAEWLSEVRDVLEDFRRAFDEEPGQITAIAVYTDADVTPAIDLRWPLRFDAQGARIVQRLEM